MKGKAEVRVQRLQTEMESLKAGVVERDEMIAPLNARVKDLEALQACGLGEGLS